MEFILTHLVLYLQMNNVVFITYCHTIILNFIIMELLFSCLFNNLLLYVIPHTICVLLLFTVY